MIAQIVVRRFDAADQSAAKQLILHGLSDRWGMVNPDLNADLDDIGDSFRDGGFWVAEVDGVLVGTGGWHFRPAQQAELVRMSVATHYRRQGVGSALLQALLNDVRANGIATVILETNSGWGSAVDFYQAQGFRITHHEASDFGQITWFRLEIASNDSVA